MDAAIARSLERTAVVRITLTEPPVGKRKQYDKQGEELKWGRIGRTRASSVLLSLNHELAAINDVKALTCWLASEAATVDSVPHI